MKKFVLPRRRALALAGGALAAPIIASGVARADTDWPNRPVKYINSFPAGGWTTNSPPLVKMCVFPRTSIEFRALA